VVRTPQRDALKAFLKTRHISTEVYYPVPLHVQECFANLGYTAGTMPVSECAAARTLALPIYPELTHTQLEAVIDGVAAFFEANDA
ncbi:MAG: DegT/DnrJ/EryC1/StrS family aminotransferase, partial [Chloroflexota bacterium]